MGTPGFELTVLSDLAFGVSGKVFILVHKPGVPDEANWTRFLEAANAACLAHGVNIWLVYADGTVPSAPQRSSASAFHNYHRSYAAILTNSALTRGVVTAIGWMTGSHIRAFRTTDFSGAFNFLQVKDADSIERATRDLKAAAKALRVGPEYAWSAAS